jgi:hypothetical protein
MGSQRPVSDRPRWPPRGVTGVRLADLSMASGPGCPCEGCSFGLRLGAGPTTGTADRDSW